MSTDSFLIVGGGLAAATAARTLREEGFDGTVAIVAGENHLPYLRPPLSKEYMKGTAERDTIFVKPAEWYAEHDVDVESGTPAAGLDVPAHTVTLADDRVLHYDRLLLATGAAPRTLETPGADARRIHYLRTVEDSESLKSALRAGGQRVVIIGSGWIGLEIAAAARGYGNEVTVIGRDAIPLRGAIGDELGTMFRELHEANGVVFSTAAIREISIEGVVTEAGMIPADLIVAGIGAIPNTGLVEAAGLAIDNGVLVDEHLAAEAADVFAAGDVANPFHPVLGQRLRNEHWANAIGTGKVVARSMLGQLAVFDDSPYFYTDQYDLGMEYSGYGPLTVGADIVYRGNRADREFIAFWLSEGRVVAGMNVNVWDVNDEVQELIRSRRVVDAARLADPSVALAEA